METRGKLLHTFFTPPVALRSPRTAGTRCASAPLAAASAVASSLWLGCSVNPFWGLSGVAVSSRAPSATDTESRSSAGSAAVAEALCRVAFSARPPRPPRPRPPRPRPRPRPRSVPRLRCEASSRAGDFSTGILSTTGSSCGAGSASWTTTSVCACCSAETGMISSSNRSSAPRVCANSSISGISAIVVFCGENLMILDELDTRRDTTRSSGRRNLDRGSSAGRKGYLYKCKRRVGS